MTPDPLSEFAWSGDETSESLIALAKLKQPRLFEHDGINFME